MEKPAPTFDRYPRGYDTREPRDSRQATRQYERLIARGIPVVSDTRDESDKPVWRGDHSFNSDAASYSLMHFIEPEVASEHPDWNFSKVKTEARDRFARRLAQDLSYERKEINHEETVVRWRPIETSDGTVELGTEYGDGMITLRQLWEHTKEYAAFVGSPAVYNTEEERAQLSMQDAFIRGSATGFVSVLSHPDSVRYVQVWEKNPGGEITSKQIDLFASTGRDFSPEESERLIRHLEVFHKESAIDDQTEEVSYAHFFIGNGRVNEQHIRMIATGLVMQQDGPSDIKVPRLRPVVLDTSPVLQSVGKFLHNEISEKLRLLKSVDRGKQKEKPVPNTKLSKKRELKVTKNYVGVSEYIPIQQEKATHQPMREAMAEWYISQTIIRHVADVPVGPHAALYWFASLEHRDVKLPPVERVVRDEPIAEKPFGEKQYIRILSRLRITVPYGLKKIFTVKHAESITKPKVIPEKPAFLVAMQDSVRGWVHKVRNRFRRLINATLNTPVRKTDVPQPIEVKKEEHDTVLREIRIVFMIWRVFSGEKSKTGRVKNVVTAQTEARRDYVEPEAPLWILLAIIRYLTLLRESGNVGQTNGKGARPKRKKPGTVKFTFAS